MSSPLEFPPTQETSAEYAGMSGTTTPDPVFDLDGFMAELAAFAATGVDSNPADLPSQAQRDTTPLISPVGSDLVGPQGAILDRTRYDSHHGVKRGKNASPADLGALVHDSPVPQLLPEGAPQESGDPSQVQVGPLRLDNTGSVDPGPVQQPMPDVSVEEIGYLGHDHDGNLHAQDAGLDVYDPVQQSMVDPTAEQMVDQFIQDNMPQFGMAAWDYEPPVQQPMLGMGMPRMAVSDQLNGHTQADMLAWNFLAPVQQQMPAMDMPGMAYQGQLQQAIPATGTPAFTLQGGVQQHGVPAGKTRYQPRKPLGLRQPKPVRTPEEVQLAKEETEARPANRQGMKLGYPQALKYHKHRCLDPSGAPNQQGCLPSCKLQADFPDQWAKLARRNRA